jgi:hypothetical protein
VRRSIRDRKRFSMIVSRCLVDRFSLDCAKQAAAVSNSALGAEVLCASSYAPSVSSRSLRSRRSRAVLSPPRQRCPCLGAPDPRPSRQQAFAGAAGFQGALRLAAPLRGGGARERVNITDFDSYGLLG